MPVALLDDLPLKAKVHPGVDDVVDLPRIQAFKFPVPRKPVVGSHQADLFLGRT